MIHTWFIVLNFYLKKNNKKIFISLGFDQIKSTSQLNQIPKVELLIEKKENNLNKCLVSCEIKKKCFIAVYQQNNQICSIYTRIFSEKKLPIRFTDLINSDIFVKLSK